jgi:hypothetical protein
VTAVNAACTAAVLLTLTSLAPRPVQAQSASDLTIAVIRGAVLQPIAHYDGASWRAPAASASWPREWLAWFSGPPGPRRLSASAPTPSSECAAPATLRTSSAASLDRPALAASSPAMVSLVHAVPRGAREWNAAASAAAPLFEKRANQNGLSGPVLARVAVAIDALTASDSGAPVFYLEASKRIVDAGTTPLEDPKGVVRLAITGWFRADGQRLVPASTKAELHWEPADDRGVATPVLSPIAIVRQPGRDVWVMMTTVPGRTSYVLYAVTASAVRVLVTTDEAHC